MEDALAKLPACKTYYHGTPHGKFVQEAGQLRGSQSEKRIDTLHGYLFDPRWSDYRPEPNAQVNAEALAARQGYVYFTTRHAIAARYARKQVIGVPRTKLSPKVFEVGLRAEELAPDEDLVGLHLLMVLFPERDDLFRPGSRYTSRFAGSHGTFELYSKKAEKWAEKAAVWWPKSGAYRALSAQAAKRASQVRGQHHLYTLSATLGKEFIADLEQAREAGDPVAQRLWAEILPISRTVSTRGSVPLDGQCPSP